MVVLKNIDVLSLAKMAAVIYAIVGLVIGVLAFLFAGSFAALFGVSSLRIAGLGAIIIIIVPLLLLIGGFVVGAIESWIYNLISGKFGGVIVDLKKNQLKHIDLISAGKIAAVVGAIVGVIGGIIVAIAGLASGSGTVALIGVVGIFGFAILFAVVSFVGVIVSIFLYNFVASKVGGFLLSFKGKELRNVNPMQFAKVEAILAFIWGVIGAIFHALAYLSPHHSAMAMPFTASLGIAGIIVAPFIYLVIGFVFAFVEAWLYNWLVPKIGGVKLTLV